MKNTVRSLTSSSRHSAATPPTAATMALVPIEAASHAIPAPEEATSRRPRRRTRRLYAGAAAGAGWARVATGSAGGPDLQRRTERMAVQTSDRRK